MSNSKIGNIEAIALILTIMINHIILNLPKSIITSTASGSIINVIFITLVMLGITYLVCKLWKKFPNKDIIDIAHFLGGKWLKIIVGLLFLCYAIFTISALLRSFSEGMKIIFFPKTPVSVIILFFIIIIVITNKLGMRVITRSTVFFMPLILFSILFIFFANLENFTFQRTFPLLGYGAYSTFFSGLSNLFAFGGISYLYLIPPYLKDNKSQTKVALISIGISGFYLLISVATLIFMFPFVTSTLEIFPMYLASRFIEFGRFIQRLDAIFLFIWILSMISYLTVAFHFCTKIFQKITNLQHNKWFVALFSILAFSIALLPKNMSQVSFLETTVYKYIVLILSFVVSISILIFANIKQIYKDKKKGVVSFDETPI